MSKRLTTEEFIAKAISKHGNKYNYSEVQYLNNITKVKIKCEHHDIIFEQRPSDHLQGKGCKKCAVEQNPNTQKDTLDIFILKSKNTHGNKYDYSNVKYSTSSIKVEIKCNVCSNVFFQRPSTHINGQGCPNCKNNKLSDLHKSTIDDFVSKAVNIHGNDYDYSQSKYITAKTNIEIICTKCQSVFNQMPNNHLNGAGCPLCRCSKGEKKILSYLTNNNIPYTQQKTFPNCKYKSKLYFDFYIPIYNLCVEFDGVQHFKDTKWFGCATSSLHLVRLRDNIKNEYCANNNIPILRIPYWDIDNINWILESKFKELQQV